MFVPILVCSIHGERVPVPMAGKAPPALRIVNGKMYNAVHMDTTGLAFLPLPTFQILFLEIIIFGTTIERCLLTRSPNTRTE
jgi:hypothetical protein